MLANTVCSDFSPSHGAVETFRPPVLTDAEAEAQGD